MSGINRYIYFLGFMCFLSPTHQLSAQIYSSYSLGNLQDSVINPQGGLCLMGGAGEHGEAMRWFLQAAQGGDILVLRTTGADG